MSTTTTGGQRLTLDTAPDILTVPQYSEIFQLGKDHVYRLIRRGDIPAIKIGGAIRIPKSRVIDQLQASV